MLTEVVQHPIEPLDLFHIPLVWPVTDHHALSRVMFQMVVGDLHPKEGNLTPLKLALAEPETQPILSKLPQDTIHPLLVCCQIFCKHDDVINICPDMSSCDLLMQHMVHEALEGGRSILQSEPHGSWLEESMGWQEC